MPWQGEIVTVHVVRLVGPDGARAVAIVDRRVQDNIIVELLVSDDGGRTWAAPALPVPGPLAWARNQIAGVGFDAAGQDGWLVAANRLLVTGDGGNSWQVLADLRDYGEVEARRWRFELPKLMVMFGRINGAYLPPTPVAIAYWTPGELWCVARWKLFCVPPRDELAKSGVKEIETDPDVVVVALAVESDGKHGWAVGSKGLILATEDGGRTWGAQPSGVNGTFAGVYFLPDALHGWVWGEDGILLTRDGGKSWQSARSK